MYSDINEAIEVLRLTLIDVTAQVEHQRKDVSQVRARLADEDKTREIQAHREIPNLLPTTYKSLTQMAKDFVIKSAISATFNKHRPRLFGLLSPGSIEHDRDLEFVRIQYRVWLSNTQHQVENELRKENEQLNELLKLEAEVRNALDTVLKLYQSGGKITDRLSVIINRLANFSNNHSHSRRDEYARANGIYFEEDWNTFSELAEELFYLAEIVLVEEVASDAIENIIEQVYDDNAQYAVDIDANGDWEQFAEPIATDDSLGYFS